VDHKVFCPHLAEQGLCQFAKRACRQVLSSTCCAYGKYFQINLFHGEINFCCPRQSVDNVLDTVMSCDRLLATLPSVRWAEAVYALTSQLLDACVTYMADHFSSVLTSDRYVIPE